MPIYPLGPDNDLNNQEDQNELKRIGKNSAITFQFIHKCWKEFFWEEFDPDKILGGYMLMEFIFYCLSKSLEKNK